MGSQLKQGIQVFFWGCVILVPLLTGIFHLDAQNTTSTWGEVFKTGLAFFGYALLIGVMGPRLLSKLRVFEELPEQGSARNRLWFERSIAIGLLGFGLAVWSGFAG